MSGIRYQWVVSDTNGPIWSNHPIWPVLPYGCRSGARCQIWPVPHIIIEGMIPWWMISLLCHICPSEESRSSELSSGKSALGVPFTDTGKRGALRSRFGKSWWRNIWEDSLFTCLTERNMVSYSCPGLTVAAICAILWTVRSVRLRPFRL